MKNAILCSDLDFLILYIRLFFRCKFSNQQGGIRDEAVFLSSS